MPAVPAGPMFAIAVLCALVAPRVADSSTGLTGAVGSSLVRVVNNDGAWEGTLEFITIDEVGTDRALAGSSVRMPTRA